MIWLIGSRGMLGSDIKKLLKENKTPFIESNSDIDITDLKLLQNFTQLHNLTYIINCSAYTAVDLAEDERDKAFAINEKGVANIATIAKDKKSVLIHISTDYVFDGSSSTPLTEEQKTAPLNSYGESKLAGEEQIQNLWPKHYIIRTAWLYGKERNNFVKTMIRLMNERSELSIVADQWGTPTYTVDLAKSIISIIENNRENYGIYHFSNTGETNWYEFALEIYRLGKKEGIIHNQCTLSPITTEQFPTKAKRPHYSLLSKEKIKRTFSLTIPAWKESLYRCIKTMVE